jgi:hypothetical protein
MQRLEPRRLRELPRERMLAPARADQEHLHGGRVYCPRLTGGGAAHEERMSMRDPGLDLHEWETRWAQLEEALAEDPADALVEACDEIEELLRIQAGDETLRAQYAELEAAYEAAREVADHYEQGAGVGPGDIASAIENLRSIREALLPAGPG